MKKYEHLKLYTLSDCFVESSTDLDSNQNCSMLTSDDVGF